MSVNVSTRAGSQENRTTITDFYENLTEDDKNSAYYKTFDVGVYSSDDRNFQVHHLIPVESAKIHKSFFEEIFGSSDSLFKGYDINNAANLIALPSNIESQTATSNAGFYAVIHRGNSGEHIDYNDAVDRLIENENLL